MLKDKGFIYVPQKVGQEIFEEIGGRTLSAPKGALAIVTPHRIEEAESKCREIKVRIKKTNGSIDFLSHFITNVGDTVVKPIHEKKAAIQHTRL